MGKSNVPGTPDDSGIERINDPQVALRLLNLAQSGREDDIEEFILLDSGLLEQGVLPDVGITVGKPQGDHPAGKEAFGFYLGVGEESRWVGDLVSKGDVLTDEEITVQLLQLLEKSNIRDALES